MFAAAEKASQQLFPHMGEPLIETSTINSGCLLLGFAFITD